MSKVVTTEYMVDIDGIPIYTKKWQPGKIDSSIPIILLHESLGCVDLWKDFPERLAAETSRIVLAYDRYGYGKSGEKTELPTVNFMAIEAVEFFPGIVAQLDLQEYILFGHSTGGSIAVMIASYDKNCRAVVTESAQAFVEEQTLEGIRKAKEYFNSANNFRRLEKWHGKKTKWVLDAWTEIWLTPEFRNWSLDGWIEKVRCPLLAIHGDNDEFGSKAFPEYLSSKTAGPGEMFILHNCGHIPHKEKPEKVLNIVRKFFIKHNL